MDISSFGITGVASITAICFLVAEIIKATKLNKKWIPPICGILGGVRGAVRGAPFFVRAFPGESRPAGSSLCVLPAGHLPPCFPCRFFSVCFSSGLFAASFYGASSRPGTRPGRVPDCRDLPVMPLRMESRWREKFALSVYLRQKRQPFALSFPIFAV